jgi:hypothetical protein
MAFENSLTYSTSTPVSFENMDPPNCFVYKIKERRSLVKRNRTLYLKIVGGSGCWEVLNILPLLSV